MRHACHVCYMAPVFHACLSKWNLTGGQKSLLSGFLIHLAIFVFLVARVPQSSSSIFVSS